MGISSDEAKKDEDGPVQLPYRAPHALLMQIPGVDWVVAAVVIAEIGVDMSVFLSVYHLASWAGVCPGNHQSAGRQTSGRARKGNVHLRTMLVGAAISGSRTKGSYLKDKFYRLKARRGSLWPALAIAHKILVAAYHMLAKGVDYKDLGEAYLDQLGRTHIVSNLKRRCGFVRVGPDRPNRTDPHRLKSQAPPRTPRLSHHP